MAVNRGWPLNRGPLNRGLTVVITKWYIQVFSERVLRNVQKILLLTYF